MKYYWVTLVLHYSATWTALSKNQSRTLTQIPTLIRTNIWFKGFFFSCLSMTPILVNSKAEKDMSKWSPQWFYCRKFAGQKGGYNDTSTIQAWYNLCYLLKTRLWLLGWGRHTLSYLCKQRTVQMVAKSQLGVKYSCFWFEYRLHFIIKPCPFVQ